MKHIIVFLMLVSGAAHAGGGGSFRNGGVAFEDQSMTLPRLVVINDNGGEYAPGLFFVQVMNTKTKDTYIMILRKDQIVESNGQRIVEFGTRSNSI